MNLKKLREIIMNTCAYCLNTTESNSSVYDSIANEKKHLCSRCFNLLLRANKIECIDHVLTITGTLNRNDRNNFVFNNSHNESQHGLHSEIRYEYPEKCRG